MDDKQKEIFHRYEEAKRAIREAEVVIEELKPQLAELIPEDQEVNSGTAVFTLSPGKPRWRYSESLQEEEKTLKEKQKEEQQTGIAEKVHGNPFVVCNLKD